MGSKVSAVEKAIVALSVRGAVLALDSARWRLRLASLEPGQAGPDRFAFAGAEAIDAELARQTTALLERLGKIDPNEAADVEAERERCAAVRKGRWLTPVVRAEVYEHGGQG